MKSCNQCNALHCALCENRNQNGLAEAGFDYQFYADGDVAKQRASITVPGMENPIECSNYLVRALCVFLSHLGEPLNKSDLSEFIWGGRLVGANSLPVLINEIRKVLDKTHYRIVTLRGLGYIMVVDDDRVRVVNSSEEEDVQAE